MSQNKIIVTGGAGYIGSHTVVELLQAGYEVLVVDNLCNSKLAVLDRVAEITGKKPEFIEADIRDAAAMETIFAQQDIAAVIHFAGLKAVGESVARPLMYYDNNLAGTVTLLKAMQAGTCRRFVFSSSATVYGSPESVPIRETDRIQTTNPYGATKAMIEQILIDLAKADSSWSIALLRYFNPVGAHESGRIGEDPAGIPNNLMPYVAQVAVGKLKQLTVHGNDYPTRDGTGERDYIHVVDLARGHLAALNHIDELRGAVPINLGTGIGTTVLEIVESFAKASGRPIPYSLGPRRPGDVPRCYADSSLAHQLIGWKAELNLERMCVDSWRWQSNNPDGY